MKILIVDDEKLARDRLARMVGTLDRYQVAGEAIHGEEAIQKAIELEPDVVLMDVRMPGKDGIEAAHELTKLSSPPAVIFCTAFDEHAIEAIDANATGYLLKPVKREALVDALGKVGRVNKVQRQAITGKQESEPSVRTHISAKTRRGIELIPLTEICFFQADHKYVTVRHELGEVLIDDTLRDLETEFGEKLVRIHRNALVMTDHIDGLDRDLTGHYRVRLRGIEDLLDVSRRHVSSLRKLVQSL